MFDKKSLTERVLELKEKYFQPDSIRRGILKTTASALLAIKLFSYCLMPVAASEPLNVKDYIKQNNYNLSTIFQLYLSPFDKDNILDENEKKVIDIIANAPEEKQEQGKALAKEIYNNKGLTPETLAKLEELNMPLEKQGPVETLEGKIIQEPENPVDIYAVIANGADNQGILGSGISGCLIFYDALKHIGVDDDNISLLLYKEATEDIINTGTKDWLKWQFNMMYHPKNQNQVEVDKYIENKREVLNAISSIPSDENDWIYIYLGSHLFRIDEKKLLFPKGNISTSEIRRATRGLDYDRIFLFIDCCYAARVLDGMRFDNYVGIASSQKDKKSIGGVLPLMINYYVRNEPNITLEEFIEKANEAINSSRSYYSKYNALLVPFYSDEELLNEALIPLDYLTK